MTYDEWLKIKGNCGYRLEINGLSHCDSTDIDCNYVDCPLALAGDDLPLSQCPMCGCETDPDEVDRGIWRQNKLITTTFWVGASVGAMIMGIVWIGVNLA
jgi:hypothetical protein